MNDTPNPPRCSNCWPSVVAHAEWSRSMQPDNRHDSELIVLGIEFTPEVGCG